MIFCQFRQGKPCSCTVRRRSVITEISCSICCKVRVITQKYLCNQMRIRTAMIAIVCQGIVISRIVPKRPAVIPPCYNGVFFTEVFGKRFQECLVPAVKLQAHCRRGIEGKNIIYHKKQNQRCPVVGKTMDIAGTFISFQQYIFEQKKQIDKTKRQYRRCIHCKA